MRILRRLYQSSFLKGVVAVAGGTALAQVAGVLFLPLLTRLYSPEAMGLWGLFVSFLGVASVASTLRYEVAIVAARSEEEALALTRSTLVLAVGMGALGGVIFEVMRRENLLGYGILPAWASPLAFVALTVLSWGMALRYYAVRHGAFGLVGRFTVIQGVARPLAQVLLASVGSVGLILGEVLGRFSGLIALWRHLPKVPGPWFLPGVLVRFKSFPLVQFPSSLLNTAALMAPIPIFVALYGPDVGGALALAQRVVGLPVALVGGAVADVFYGSVAEMARANPARVRPFLLRIVARLFLLALALGLALRLFAPTLTPIVFGDHWEVAGKMMAVMAPWVVAQLTVSPVSRVVFVSQRPWVKLIYDTLSLSILSLPFVWRCPFELALVVLSWAYVALYALYLLVLVWLAGNLACVSESNSRNFCG